VLVLPPESVLGSLDSLAGPAGLVWVPLLASSPQSAFPRCEESQTHAVYSARVAGYRLALASDFRLAGSHVILIAPELSMTLEHSNSAGSLLA
jgi:hypothetical protein